MDYSSFLLCTSLLAAPGPTNTLLAASGAAIGVRQSLPLLAAVLAGYMLAIGLLHWVAGPLMTQRPLVGVALHAAIAIYLAYLSVKLWRQGTETNREDRPVTFGNVFIATLLNPKSAVFAFTLLPAGAGADSIAPPMLALAALILIIGGCWIAVSDLLLRGAADPSRSPISAYKLGAIVLAIFAGTISVRAIAMI